MAMRVTNQMIANRMLLNIRASLRRQDVYNQQLSTGKRILAPSDDPSGTEVAMRLRTTLTETAQYLENVADGISWLNSTDAALGQITSVLQRARQLAVYAASDPLGDDPRRALVFEVDQLIEDLINVGNLKQGNRYLFSGENTQTQPFAISAVKSDVFASSTAALGLTGQFTVNGVQITVNAGDSLTNIMNAINAAAAGATARIDGDAASGFWLVVEPDSGSVTADLLKDDGADLLQQLGFRDRTAAYKHIEVSYSGTATGTSGLRYEIGPGITVLISIHGDEAIKPAIDALIKLREDLESSNVDALGGEDLELIDKALDLVLRWRAEAGARVNRLELVQRRLEHSEINTHSLLSRVEDVDVAEAIMNLKMEENVYRLALAAGARIIQPSLLDFLR